MSITIKADKQQFLEFMADQMDEDGDPKDGCDVTNLSIGAFKFVCDELDEEPWIDHSNQGNFRDAYNIALGYAACAAEHGHDPDKEFLSMYEKYKKRFSEGDDLRVFGCDGGGIEFVYDAEIREVWESRKK